MGDDVGLCCVSLEKLLGTHTITITRTPACPNPHVQGSPAFPSKYEDLPVHLKPPLFGPVALGPAGPMEGFLDIDGGLSGYRWGLFGYRVHVLSFVCALGDCIWDAVQAHCACTVGCRSCLWRTPMTKRPLAEVPCLLAHLAVPLLIQCACARPGQCRLRQRR